MKHIYIYLFIYLFIIQILIRSNNAEKVFHMTDSLIRMHIQEFTLINPTSAWCTADYYKWVYDDQVKYVDRAVALSTFRQYISSE
jgi:hypothetical protein